MSDDHALAAVEDLTTWTEVDSGSDITVTSSTITVDTMNKSAVSWVTEDQGAGSIGDFTWQFEFNMSVKGSTNTGLALAAGNTVGTHIDLLATNDAVGLLITDPVSSGYTLWSWDYSDDAGDRSVDLSLSTTYYVELDRTGTTFTTTICTGSHGCGTPVDTLTTTVPTTTFRHAMTSSNDLAGADPSSYTIANVDLAPGVGDSITITNIANGAKQQRVIATNNKSVTISGTYVDSTGDPTAIEYRWDGGAWTTLQSSPSGGTFTGTPTLGSGQGSLEVRFADDVGVTDTVTDFGIGDIFLIAGQSNASGGGGTNQLCTCTLGSKYFRIDDAWTADADDQSHSNGSTGSPWPLLADLIETAESTPVFMVTTAQGGTSLTIAPTDWTNGDTIFERAVTQANTDSGIDDVLAILWHQGEFDATNASPPSAAAYNAALDTLLTEFRAEGGTLSDTVLIAAALGEFNAVTTEAGLDNVRNGTMEAWDDNANIYAGPVLYDVNLSVDGLHFQTNGELATLADRWFAAIEDVFYGGSQASPVPTGFFHSSDLTQVHVDFDQNVTVADASALAWDVVDNGGNKDANITNIAASGSRVTITFSPALVEPITVSLGQGNDADGTTVPLGGGADTLPGRSFVTESTALDSFLATFTVNYDTTGFNAALPVLFLIAGLFPVAMGFWLLWSTKQPSA